MVATKTSRLIKSFCGTLFFIIVLSLFKYFTDEDFFVLKNIFQIGVTAFFLGIIFYRFLFK